MSTENTTGSDLKQQLQHSSSTTIVTENRYSQTQPHRKTTTHLTACKPMHISDATTKQRGTSVAQENTSNTDINHEEEHNSCASRSNSIERYRSPNNTSRNTGTQTTPSPSSSESREGTATDKQLSDLELEDPSSDDCIAARVRKHTTAGNPRFTSSDRETEPQDKRISSIYSRLETKQEEELHHEGDDEYEGDEHEIINEKTSFRQKSCSPTSSSKSSKRKDSLVFNNSKLSKTLRICNLSKRKPTFTHSNIVDLEEEEEEEDSALPVNIRNKTAGTTIDPGKHPTFNMVGDNDIALNGDAVERQELTALEPLSANKSILKHENSTNIIMSEDSPDGYITRLDKDGNIEQVPDNCDEETSDVNPNPLADFMSADILTKPFNFVAGSATKSRFNPFRKKSGLLNVLARQSTKNRIVAKNGQLNTINEYHSSKFWKDIFITLIDINWGWIFLLFASAFFSSWLFFAVIWYATFWQHGDFLPENKNNTDFRPCADNIIDFTSCFLFSLETQHTIGYGGRATTEQCPFAIITMSFQSILGVIIQACMAGIIFAKFTVPRARGETIVYSKNAVITLRNGALYLLCRVSDLRKSSLLEAHVRMLFVHKEVTDEGEVIPYYQFDLECGSEIDGGNDRVLMFWPTTLAHKIDEESPLYELNPRDLLQSQFEVIVTLEGVTEETGNTIQVRTSYLPNEILWGHHFDNEVVKYDKQLSQHIVCHGIINRTATDDTPRVSAKQLERRQKKASSSSNRCNSSSGASITESDSKNEETPDKKVSILSTGSGAGSFYGRNDK